ncbi:helix-turn-helix domain-containing protein [Thermoflavimicrobium daqui]
MRAYKVEIKPIPEQRNQIVQAIGMCRFL